MSKIFTDITNTMLSESNAIHQAIDALSVRQIENAVNAILGVTLQHPDRGGKVVISGIGKSGLVGQKIASTLSSTGTPAVFIHSTEAAHGDLGVISKEDIVILISNSGRNPELTYVGSYCKHAGIPTIGITSDESSYVASVVDYKIILPKVKEVHDSVNAPTCSSTVVMALGDAIAVSLMNLREFTKEDFKELHPAGKVHGND